jgi:hypothetical protein
LNYSTNAWKSSFNPSRTQVSGFDPKSTFEYFIISLGLQNYITPFQYISIMINKCVFDCPFFNSLALTNPHGEESGCSHYYVLTYVIIWKGAKS